MNCHTLSLHDALPVFEVGRLGLVASLDEGLEASLHEGGEAAAEHHLLAEEIGLGLLREGRLEHAGAGAADRSEEHTSELQSLMRISYAVFCLKKKTITHPPTSYNR